ncbi:MAG: hypothetical protein U0905_11885 [Pirellulales bacterium]
MGEQSGAIARKANNEDKAQAASGKDAFKAQKIVDEAGLLGLSAMYADLNPVSCHGKDSRGI